MADIDIDALQRRAKEALSAKSGDGTYQFVGDDQVIVTGRTLDALIERLRRAEDEAGRLQAIVDAQDRLRSIERVMRGDATDDEKRMVDALLRRDEEPTP